MTSEDVVTICKENSPVHNNRIEKSEAHPDEQQIAHNGEKTTIPI